jgi:hypothetical protein
VPGDCTAVQIPIQPSTVVTIDGGVTVCESSGAVDLNAVNLREIFAPREAGVTP